MEVGGAVVGAEEGVRVDGGEVDGRAREGDEVRVGSDEGGVGVEGVEEDGRGDGGREGDAGCDGEGGGRGHGERVAPRGRDDDEEVGSWMMGMMRGYVGEGVGRAGGRGRVVPGGTRDSGVPGLGETLSGVAKGEWSIRDHAQPRGKRERQKVRTVGGWEDVLAGRARDLVKGETTWKAETRIYSLLSP